MTYGMIVDLSLHFANGKESENATLPLIDCRSSVKGENDTGRPLISGSNTRSSQLLCSGLDHPQDIFV